MDGKKILEVIGMHRKYFEDNKIGKIDYPHDKLVCDIDFSVVDVRSAIEMNVLSHCHGMLDQMEEFVKEGRMDKVFRWLGFIQGCLWSDSCHTLNDLKNHNRPNNTD